MRYLSVCSGIEAATVAWHGLGWTPAAFAEIDRFPSQVLAHHYPAVPNHGDFTTIEADTYGAIDLLVGGTPCQAFSVAGKRAGLDDPRGNLTIEFARLAGRLRPRWLVWENVPGVLSIDGGRTFGAFLGMLGQLGYRCGYRVLDAQHFGVPQRRRRVFVVGHFGDWRRAAAVLFERHSLSGHPAPRREAGQGVTYDVAPCIGTSGRGFERAGDTRGQDCLIASTGDTSHCLNAGGMGRQDFETETLIAHSLSAEGFDASEDGTGRGTPLVPVMSEAEAAEIRKPRMVPTRRGDKLRWETDNEYWQRQNEMLPIAFSAKDHGADALDNCAPTLRAGGFDKSHANSGNWPAVAFNLRGREGGAMAECDDLASMRAASGGSSRSYIGTHMAVRRLTPRECERLQGFPDDYTKISEKTADGPRYKALGNSMAVPVMRWLGERIQAVEEVTAC